MASLTGTQIANTYKQLLQVGSGNVGLGGTLQTVQDGDAANSPLQLSTNAVNINGTFQLSGVTLTASASTLNAVADLTGATGLVAVSAGNVYGRTLVAGTGIIISNADGTEGNPTIAMVPATTSGSYKGPNDIEVNAVGQIVSISPAVSVSVATIKSAAFEGGTFVGSTGGFSSNVSIGDDLVVRGDATLQRITVSAVALTRLSATSGEFSGTVSAGFFAGDGRFLVNVPLPPSSGTMQKLTSGTGINLTIDGVVSTTIATSGTVNLNANQSFGIVSATNIDADELLMAGVSAANVTEVAAVSVLTSVNLAAITSINSVIGDGTGFVTDAELAAVSVALATSIGNSNTRITSVSDYAVALSATMATSIGNSNTNITTNINAITSINSVIGDGSGFATDAELAAVSATMATSIGNSNTNIAAVSVLTSVNLAAITSINSVIGDGTGFATDAELAAVSATLATSIGNSNTNIAAVSVLTSVNLAAITSITAVNTQDVTLTGTPDYITISNQVITRNQIDLTADVTGNLPVGNLNSGTGASGSSFWRGDGVWASPSGSGDVVGPASSTDNAIVRFDSTTGKLLQNSTVTISDAGAIAAASLTLTTDLAIADGGTGASTASAARTALDVDPAGTDNSTNVTLTGTPDYITISGQTITRGPIVLTTDVSGILPIANGGTNASSAGAALTALGAAASGANSDITSLTGLTTDLTVAQGGTGAGTFAANGILFGNGTSAIGATAVGTSGHVLTSNGAGVAPTFQAAAAGGATDIDGLSDALTNSSGGTVGLGTGALAADDASGNLNTALGFDALNDVVTGSRNVAVGHSAGSKVTSGNNTFIGERAGQLLVTGSENTAVGGAAMISAITGNGNSAFGYGALGGGSGTSMGQNVGVGYLAGYRVTTGDGNTIVGYDNGATNLLTTGSNNIVLGNLTSASSATVSNEITLGNASITSFRIPGVDFYSLNGNVGIGTAAPSQKLTVEGTDARIYLTGANTDINMTGTADGQLSLDGNGYGFGIALNSSGANLYTNSTSRALILGTDETERMRITGAGLVGIGTTAPNEPLTVQRNGTTVSGLSPSNVASFQSTSTNSQSSYVSIIAGSTGSTAQAAILFGDADDPDIGKVLYRNSDNSMDFVVNAASRMKILSSGNVGIGTASPAKQLSITKSALATINTLTDGATITPDFDAGQNFSVTLAGNRTLANPTNIDAGQTGSIFITQDGTGSRTLSFGSYWDFPGGTAPTLSTAAGAIDRIDYIVRTGTSIHAVATLNLS